MHIDYTALGSFMLGILVPWMRRQAVQALQWIIFTRICNLETKITEDVTKLIKLRLESLLLKLSFGKKKEPNDPSNN